MDLLTQARVLKINEMAEAVLADSSRRARLHEPRTSSRLDLSPRDLNRYSLARAVQTQIAMPEYIDKFCGFERECSNELAGRFEVPLGGLAIPMDVLEHRALSPHYLIDASAPESLSFIDALRNRSIVFGLGAQLLPDLRDDVSIPRQVSDAPLTWLAPSGSVTAADSSFGQISAIPKTGCVITELSEQLLRQSSADPIIKAGLAAVMGVGVDLAAIAGAGGVEPLGILNMPGIGTLSGTNLAYVGLVGVQKTVADANAILNGKTLGYATTPTAAEQLKLRQQFTGTDSPLWRGALHEGEIAGVRAVSSKQVPSGTMLYGDWSTVYVCAWGPLMLSADRGGTRFNQARVGIRVLWFVDVLCTSPISFVKITSIT
jgi:hypothetical protein